MIGKMTLTDSHACMANYLTAVIRNWLDIDSHLAMRIRLFPALIPSDMRSPSKSVRISLAYISLFSRTSLTSLIRILSHIYPFSKDII